MRTVTPENAAALINTTEPLNHKKPVDHLISELRQIATALATESPRFVAKGLTEKFCKSAPVIADILEQKQALWVDSRGGTPEVKKEFKIQYPEMVALRDDFADTLEMALFDIPEAMNTIEAVLEGDGPEDTVVDISTLVVVAQKYPAQVTAAGLSEDRVLEIALQGKEFSALYAKTLALPGGSLPAKTARDKARTFGEAYVALVRYFRDRIYKNEPEKFAMFTSKYTSERNRAQKLQARRKKEAEAESLKNVDEI